MEITKKGREAFITSLKDNLEKQMRKQKKYTEEEIFKIIDEWHKNLKEGKLPDPLIDEEIKELKRKFMTSQGFIKAIDKAGLRGSHISSEGKQ